MVLYIGCINCIQTYENIYLKPGDHMSCILQPKEGAHSSQGTTLGKKSPLLTLIDATCV